MLNKIFATTTLSAALLIGGLDKAAASELVGVGLLPHSIVIAAYTAGQRALQTKGLQYRPGTSGAEKVCTYRFNDSKKNHKPAQSKKYYYSKEVSRPNPSRKLSHTGRVV